MKQNFLLKKINFNLNLNFKFFFFTLFLLNLCEFTIYAQSIYKNILEFGSIRTVYIVEGFCGNISLSTLVGKMSNSNKCLYQVETAPNCFDSCGPYYLNGAILELLVGKGYDCAATHVRSNVTNEEAFDEFLLISNQYGQYITTAPSVLGEIKLH